MKKKVFGCCGCSFWKCFSKKKQSSSKSLEDISNMILFDPVVQRLDFSAISVQGDSKLTHSQTEPGSS